MDHVGDHMGPVKQGSGGGSALLLAVDLGDDGLPGHRLVEEPHHGLGTQHCTEGERRRREAEERGCFYTEGKK